MLSVKPALHEAVVRIPVVSRLGQQTALAGKVLTHILRGNHPCQKAVVEIDYVRVAVADNPVSAHGGVETHNASAEEGLNPISCSQIQSRLTDQTVYPRDELSLDTLRFYGGDYY